MDALIQAALSKVTVECTDPSGLLPDVQAILSSRLPLKNLHWKSPTRPVRSIESLHIDLVPAAPVPDEQTAPKDATPGPVPHRRHQIPGLRQTPYLKIYLLRCDDNETYKASSRKLLREWIKTHAASQQAGGAPGTQDNHDAFEWLILHVSQDGPPSEKAASTSKWPGRGPTSVLEKIKADFNGSSKPAVDRVAQLRLPKAGNTQDRSELIDQLNDLVDKIKNAILASFDLRVGQYEEDIREKDSQRNLPGWNFCTFFILKEGLARGFENMGLLEDALAGYDELAVGLETAIGEYLSGTSDQHGGVFLSYSEDRKRDAELALEASIKRSKGDDDGDGSDAAGDNDGSGITLGLDEEHFPLDSTKKPYRDMILANNISIFDFRTYVFSRQLTLLLRAAGAPSLRDKESTSNRKSGHKAKAENLTLLAEVCERATEFIAVAARTLRCDLECALADTAVQADDATKKLVVDNIVSSWTYAATCQILSQTATPALILPESSLRKARNLSDTSEVAAEAAETRPNVPRRLSSLQSSAAAAGRSMKHGTSSDVHPPAVPVPKSGSEDLASGRGELCQLARGALEGMGKRPGWVGKWENLDLLFDDGAALSGELEEVSLDNDDVHTTEKSSMDDSPAHRLAGVELPVLRHALSSRKEFCRLYEELTDDMFRYYVAASRRRSAQAAMSEIAVLRFRQEDYSTAASLFHQLVPFYADSLWVMLEGTVLELYARCLKELKQNEEYVRIVLRLLSRYASYTQANLTKKQKMTVASTTPSVRSAVHPYIEDLLQASTGLQKECAVPLTDFFGDIEVDPEIRHYEDKDGFQLQLRLRFFLDKDIKIDSLKIRLVNGTGPQSNEVWLEHLEDVLIKSSSTKLLIGSSTTLQGKYFVDRIEMRTGNIVFTMGGGSNFSVFPPGFRDTDGPEEENRPYIWCYPPVDGLEARISFPHYINLEETRTLEVELESGRNAVSKGVLRVRPATAGLRLRIAEITIVDGKIDMTTHAESGNIEFVDFGAGSSVRFRLPYTVDENHTTLSAKLDVAYETDKGRFTYSSANTIVSTLPVSVNVQDIFKDDVLFSRFTVSPAMLVPLRVLGCDIPNSEFFEVESSMQGPVALDVFPKQPASVLYKIRQRQERQTQGSKRSLRLTVQFTCLDEECLMLVKQKFRAAIEQSKFRHLSRLLTPHVVEAFQTQLSTADMEMIGLVREVEMLSFESVQWGGVLSALREPLRKEVQDWLLQWHQSNPTLTLPDPDPSILGRRIVIPVDVPEVQIVHTAELRLADLKGHPDRDQVHAAVGHMIPAELRLRHTRRWSPTSAENPPLEFAYEIHANPEFWLVGGRRRGNFTAEEGETCTFAIMLLPQRAGHLLLPTIDIKTFVAAAATTTTTNPTATPAGNTSTSAPAVAPLQPQRRQIHSELDYRNHGETVLVLPDLRKTTVSLEPGHPPGLWLVDSEPRIEA